MLHIKLTYQKKMGGEITGVKKYRVPKTCILAPIELCNKNTWIFCVISFSLGEGLTCHKHIRKEIARN